ncbi:MAG: TetR family transcriptional regulator, partial [Acidimicrobiia bacterium]
MSAVATEAGVATGTAYVHYESKDDLVLATYVEIKSELGDAALVGYDPDAAPAARYRHLVRGAY